MGHKIHNKRRADNSLTWCQAFWKVFTSPREELTMFVGNIAMVVVKRDSYDNDILDVSLPEVRNSMGVTLLVRNTKVLNNNHPK